MSKFTVRLPHPRSGFIYINIINNKYKCIIYLYKCKYKHIININLIYIYIIYIYILIFSTFLF